MTILEPFNSSILMCEKPSTVTLGTFDGVHAGHSEILARVVTHACAFGTKGVVVTFHRPPASVLGKDSSPNLLTTNREKLTLFEQAGIDTTCILEFNESISRMNAEDFIREYLVTCLGMKHFVVGYDHGLGRDRSGTAGELAFFAKRFGFTLDIVEPVLREGREVKSSIIRSLLREGDVSGVSILLGRDYSIAGTVVHGSALGRTIGFPTANIVPDDPDKILPTAGVYSGWVEMDGGKKSAVISLGPRPTMGISGEALEVHIPDFQKDLYGTILTTGFIRRLRDIKKFDSKKELIDQIRRDIEAVPFHIVS